MTSKSARTYLNNGNSSRKLCDPLVQLLLLVLLLGVLFQSNTLGTLLYATLGRKPWARIHAEHKTREIHNIHVPTRCKPTGPYIDQVSNLNNSLADGVLGSPITDYGGVVLGELNPGSVPQHFLSNLVQRQANLISDHSSWYNSDGLSVLCQQDWLMSFSTTKARVIKPTKCMCSN